MGNLQQDLAKYKQQIENYRRQKSSSTPSAEVWVNPFDTYKPENDIERKAHTAVKEWAYSCARVGHRGLVLYSASYGTGKTHLAKLAFDFLRQVRDADDRPILCNFIGAATLFQQIRDAYDGGGSEVELLNAYTRHPLIIDDLGQEYYKNNEWAQQIFYRILDRICERRGLLITTNMRPAEVANKIGGASSSRLMGMTGSTGWVCMDGIRDHRVKK